MMTPDTETALTRLLRRWNRHQDLRSVSEGEITDLAESRRLLDEARDALRRVA